MSCYLPKIVWDMRVINDEVATFRLCMLFLLRLSIHFPRKQYFEIAEAYLFSCSIELFKLVHYACLLVTVFLVFWFLF